MPHACVDVGSNTTRLLVAECAGDRVHPLVQRRVFTRVGKALGSAGRIPPAKVAEVAEVVAAQTREAAGLGARRTAVVATAAIRTAPNRGELTAALEAASGLAVTVLSGPSEARLAFEGAVRTETIPVAGPIAVIDVGGGSTEVAVGTIDGGVSWSASVAIGSGALTDAHVHSDPPTAAELKAVRGRAAAAFAALDRPRLDRAVAVGGSATSLRRLLGGELSREALRRAVGTLAATPRADLARQYGLDPERARLLPAGVVVLDELAGWLDRPLTLGRGGLREGVVLRLAAGGEI